MHNVYNHSNGVFSLTSLIENIWAELKNSIKKMRTSIHDSNFIYFLKEAEYGGNIKFLFGDNRLENLANLLTTLKSETEINYINKEDLKL